MMPTFVLVVFLNQIDRQNISFAALTMNRCEQSALGGGNTLALFFGWAQPTSSTVYDKNCSYPASSSYNMAKQSLGGRRTDH